MNATKKQMKREKQKARLVSAIEKVEAGGYEPTVDLLRDFNLVEGWNLTVAEDGPVYAKRNGPDLQEIRRCVLKVKVEGPNINDVVDTWVLWMILSRDWIKDARKAL